MCIRDRWNIKSARYWSPGTADSEDLETGTVIPGTWTECSSAVGLQVIVGRNRGVNPTEEATSIRQEHCSYFNYDGSGQ